MPKSWQKSQKLTGAAVNFLRLVQTKRGKFRAHGHGVIALDPLISFLYLIVPESARNKVPAHLHACKEKLIMATVILGKRIRFREDMMLLWFNQILWNVLLEGEQLIVGGNLWRISCRYFVTLHSQWQIIIFSRDKSPALLRLSAWLRASRLLPGSISWNEPEHPVTALKPVPSHPWSGLEWNKKAFWYKWQSQQSNNRWKL